VTDRHLLVSLAASLTIHLALIPVAARFFHQQTSIALRLPVELIDVPRVKQLEDSEPTSPETVIKPEKLTAPKLLSKPQIVGSRAPESTKYAGEPPNKTEKSLEMHEEPGSNDLRETPSEGGWNILASKPSKDEPSAGTGGIAIQGNGETTSGLDRGAKDIRTGGGIGPSQVAAVDARPLEGHQAKPLYPASARRARAQGTTFLKFRVLATGKVGEVRVEKSAGRRDLDEAAADAVKKWLFEPARVGTEPVSVWVILPVEFKLQ
jgi:TonB family protein